MQSKSDLLKIAKSLNYTFTSSKKANMLKELSTICEIKQTYIVLTPYDTINGVMVYKGDDGLCYKYDTDNNNVIPFNNNG
jgi:hypothetical protein